MEIQLFQALVESTVAAYATDLTVVTSISYFPAAPGMKGFCSFTTTLYEPTFATADAPYGSTVVSLAGFTAQELLTKVAAHFGGKKKQAQADGPISYVEAA